MQDMNAQEKSSFAAPASNLYTTVANFWSHFVAVVLSGSDSGTTTECASDGRGFNAPISATLAYICTFWCLLLLQDSKSSGRVRVGAVSAVRVLHRASSISVQKALPVPSASFSRDCSCGSRVAAQCASLLSAAAVVLSALHAAISSSHLRCTSTSDVVIAASDSARSSVRSHGVHISKTSAGCTVSCHYCAMLLLADTHAAAALVAGKALPFRTALNIVSKCTAAARRSCLQRLALEQQCKLHCIIEQHDAMVLSMLISHSGSSSTRGSFSTDSAVQVQFN
eukprot:18744-Heterococcus_DN1.PRE.2